LLPPELDSSFTYNPMSVLPKPKVGDVIGTLSIPKIKKTIKIIEGTGNAPKRYVVQAGLVIGEPIA
jgi:sortase (surface protein transpeptidase)